GIQPRVVSAVGSKHPVGQGDQLSNRPRAAETHRGIKVEPDAFHSPGSKVQLTGHDVGEQSRILARHLLATRQRRSRTERGSHAFHVVRPVEERGLLVHTLRDPPRVGLGDSGYLAAAALADAECVAPEAERSRAVVLRDLVGILVVARAVTRRVERVTATFGPPGTRASDRDRVGAGHFYGGAAGGCGEALRPRP